MTFFLYLLAVIGARTESALGKANGLRHGSVTGFNSSKASTAAILAAAAALLAGIQVNGMTVGYGALYGASLAVSMCAGLIALTLGSMAIVSMLASFSLIIPTIFGLIFLEESLSPMGWAGLALLLASILLLNLKKGTAPLTPKCWFFSILTMISNGICSVIQKLHQLKTPGQYQKEFMLFGMTTAALLLIVYGLVVPKKTTDASPQGAGLKTVILGASAGACNCIANFLTLSLAATENASILFPILSASNAVGAVLVGLLVFHEKLTKLQAVSVLLGILSVVLLKI